MKSFFFKTSASNSAAKQDIYDDFVTWQNACNKLNEIIDNSDFSKKYPGISKKDIIDSAFDRGSLSTMSEKPREELRNKFYLKI